MTELLARLRIAACFVAAYFHLYCEEGLHWDFLQHMFKEPGRLVGVKYICARCYTVKVFNRGLEGL